MVEKRPTNEEIEKFNKEKAEKKEKEEKEKEEKEKAEKQKAEEEKAKQESKGQQDQTEIVNRMNSMELRRVSEDQAENEGDNAQSNRSQSPRVHEENKVNLYSYSLLTL